MAINKNSGLFKGDQKGRQWVYAPVLFFTGLKTLIYIKNNYGLYKK
jgi:hypothetical protein